MGGSGYVSKILGYLTEKGLEGMVSLGELNCFEANFSLFFTG
jgi:hypothetical protein